MDKEAKLVELFRSLAKQKDVFLFGEVTEITGDTCSVKIGDLELTDVRMKATNKDEDKLVLTPHVGSTVVVGANAGDLRSLFIIKVDDPAKIEYKHKDTTIEIDGESGDITINGGDLGGLIKIEELVNKINAIENDINSLKQVFTTWIPVPQDGGAALKAAAGTWMGQTITQTQKSEIEDTKVTH